MYKTLLLGIFYFAGSSCQQTACLQTWSGLFSNLNNDFEPVLSSSARLTALEANAQLMLEEGASLTVFCEQGFTSNVLVSTQQLSCTDGHFVPALEQLRCNAASSSRVQQSEQVDILKMCAVDQALVVQVNSALGWKDLYYTCYSRTTMTATKSLYWQMAAAQRLQYDVARPYDRWSVEQYGNFLVPKAYTRRQQIIAFAAVLDNYDYYFARNYLQRGHLSTFSAPAYFYSRNATCEYVNNSPQWMTVNMGNLHAAEVVLAQLAALSATDFQVFTHSTGRLQLPNSAGSMVPLSLYMEAGGAEHLVDVPSYIMKRFTSPLDHRLYVVYVMNNPFLSTVPVEPLGCNDRTDTALWWPTEVFRTGTVADIERGYTWLCEPLNYDSFVKLHA